MMDTQVLCKSLSGLNVPLVTITDFSNPELMKDRKVIVMQARVHPGETNPSWIMHGVIKHLISKDPVAKDLRERYIFKLIPMINPDGVVFGNYRTSYLGKDMNRLFMSKSTGDGDSDYVRERIDERLIPEIVAVRQLLFHI